jgi:translation initiation factor 1
MAAAKRKSSNKSAGWREFGDDNAATQRATPNLPPEKQDLRVQATRAGRKGKTVTIITGFQSNSETLQALLKQLKGQCGCGGTVKDNEIEIQGEHKQKILEILKKQGYKAKISGG